MTARIIIDFENGEGEIRRILGVVEQRGFEIVSVALPETDGTARMTLGLKARGERSLDILSRQIARLHCVSNVEAQTAGTEFERECA